MKEVDDSPLATQRVAEVLDLRIKGSEMKHCIAYSRIKMDGAKATGVLFSMKEPGACQEVPDIIWGWRDGCSTNN